MHMQIDPSHVSIHAPARGATTTFSHSCMPCTMFQSTLPHGERPVKLRLRSSLINVSIHAPARGATRPDSASIQYDQVSIHAPARGATSICHRLMLVHDCFNPRSRTGSDYASAIDCDSVSMVSIHAPARGATHAIASTVIMSRWFQSTLPHGERPETSVRSDRYVSLFQSTLPHGERRSCASLITVAI